MCYFFDIAFSASPAKSCQLFFRLFAKTSKSIKCQLCLSTLELSKFRAQEDPWFSACTFLLSLVSQSFFDPIDS